MAEKPRHFLRFRVADDGCLEISCVLHDSIDLERTSRPITKPPIRNRTSRADFTKPWTGDVYDSPRADSRVMHQGGRGFFSSARFSGLAAKR